MKRYSVNALFLFAGIILWAPASVADEVLLDEITIRVIDDENTTIEVNDIALPPAGPANNKRRGPASENADERASQGAANAADKAKEKMSKAAEKAAKAAENAANAAESAAEAAESAAESTAIAREKANEASEKGKGKGRNK